MKQKTGCESCGEMCYGILCRSCYLEEHSNEGRHKKPRTIAEGIKQLEDDADG